MTSYWEIFSRAASKFENNTAVFMYQNGSHIRYTYGKLFQASQVIYSTISQQLQKENTIGILINHHFLIPTILSVIHRCSCSFIFLDDKKDDTHIQSIISDLKINIIFSTSTTYLRERFKCENLSNLLSIPKVELYLMVNKDKSKISDYRGKEIAYYIKTSGSTSVAKNVGVFHKCIEPNIEDFKNIFNVQSSDVIYFSTPLTFDPSIIEIYLAAMSGAALMICPNELDALLPSEETNLNHSVTIWQTTPSKLTKCGDILNIILGDNSPLRVLALGGEPFSCYDKLCKIKHSNNKTEIFNLYGITEVSCWASVAKVTFPADANNTTISLGATLSQTLLKVCDDYGQTVSKGVGVINIGGSIRKCLVGPEIAEYLIDPEKNNEFADDTILWRNTGDIGEIKSDHLIYFKGRKDRVIKRFGNKVSLLEIEEECLKFHAVHQCACLHLNDNNFICLFYSCLEVKDIKDKLFSHLKTHLNTNSMPDYLHQIDCIPLNENGKVSIKTIRNIYNKLCLNKITQSSHKEVFCALLKEIFENAEPNFKYLKHKSFVDLGGTSMSAMQLMNKFENIIHKHYPDVFVSLLNTNISLSNILDDLDHRMLHNQEEPLSHIIAERNTKPSLEVNEHAVCSDNIEISETVNSKKRKHDNNIPDKIEVIWKFNLGKCVDSSPVIHNMPDHTSYVLVGSHAGKVAILDHKTGAQIYVVDVPSRVETSIFCFQIKSKMCASFGCYDGSFFCISLENFKTLWNVPLQAMIKSKACIIKSKIYIATYDSIIWSFCAETGKKVSNIKVGKKGISADLLSSSDGCIYAATLEGRCVCIIFKSNDLMEIKWQKFLLSPVFANPIFVKNETQLIISEVNKKLHCLDVVFGDALWTFETEGLIFSSCSRYLAGNTEVLAFGCHDRHTYHISYEQKEPILRRKILHTSEMYATPCIADSETAVCASTDGSIDIVDISAGAVVRRHQLPGEVYSSPVVKDDLLYIGCRDDYLYCLKIIK